MASNYKKIGSLRQNDKDGFYIQLESDVEIFLKGEKVKPYVGKTGKASLTLQDPRANLRKMIDNGHAKNVEAAEAQIKDLETKYNYIKFEIFSTGN